jgi:hypothetical protein
MTVLTTALQPVTGRGNRTATPYLISNSIDLSKHTTLAVNDTMKVFTIPANTLILCCSLEFEALTAGEGTDTTWNLGVVTASTGGVAADVDAFVATIDGDAAVVGTYGIPIAANLPTLTSAATTIDLELQAASNPPETGIIRVWAVIMDIDNYSVPTAADAARDLLA